MTNYEAWKNAEHEAEVAKENAKAAKSKGLKSNYEFWLAVFNTEMEKANGLFIAYAG